MSVFTFLMFVLATACAYIWWFYLRGKDVSSAQQASFAKLKAERGLGLSPRQAIEPKTKEYLNGKPELSAETSVINQVIHLSDIGLEMLSFDAQVKRKDLIKHKSYRWYDLHLDRGDRNFVLSSGGDRLVVATENITLSQLDSEALARISVGTCIEYEGASYKLANIIPATFCPNANELHPETLRIWEFESEVPNHGIEIKRFSDGVILSSLIFHLKHSQVEILP